jgi:hypothetical protein
VQENETVDNAVAVFGDVQVNGRVQANAVAVFGKVRIGPQGVVAGNAVSVFGTVTLSDGAQIGGNKVQIPGMALPGIAGSLAVFFAIFRLAIFLGFFAMALLYAVLFPAPLQRLTAFMESDLLIAFFWGVLGFLVIVPLTLVLVVTLVGIPLIPFEVLFILFAVIAGYFTAARAVGKKMLDALRPGPRAVFWDMLSGMVVLWLAGLVPFIGLLIKFLAGLAGFGAVLASIFKYGGRKPEPMTPVGPEDIPGHA